MSMLDPHEAQQREQSRQRAIRILTLVLGLSGLFCFFLFTKIINPPASKISLGTVDRFAIGQTQQISITQLNASETIPTRPEVSEDPVFITRYADGSWRAILGWDGLSGCIVQPNGDGSQFTDPCSNRIYDSQGQDTQPGSTLKLGVLPIEINENTVILVDEFTD